MMIVETTSISITDARTQLNDLRDQRRNKIDDVRSFERERNDLRKNRDERNNKVKELFQTARDQREKRDKINEEVALNKQMRGILREQVDEINESMKTLEEKMDGMGVKRYKKGVSDRIRQLEFKLMTTPNIARDEEQRLVEEIESLSEEFEKQELFREVKDEHRAFHNKLRSLRLEIRTHHAAVKALAQQSQQHQETMIKSIEDAKKLRDEADEFHKSVIEVSTKIKTLRDEIGDLSKEGDRLRRVLGEETRTERKRRRKDEAKKRREEEEETAQGLLATYKDGGKISFDEFKILLNRDMLSEKKEVKEEPVKASIDTSETDLPEASEEE